MLRLFDKKGDLELDEIGKLIVGLILLVTLIVIVTIVINGELSNQGDKLGTVLGGLFN
jgi:hypothetical protein